MSVIGPVHIALYSPGWPLKKFQSGIVTYVHWMKLEFEKQGHQVSIFTGALDPSGNAQGIYPIPRRPLWARLMRRAAERLRSRKKEPFDFSDLIAKEILRVHKLKPIDIIEMEESFGWFAGVAQKTSIPLVVKLHGPAFLSYVGPEINTSFARERVDREGRALAEATAIIAPSQVTLAETLARYRLKPRVARHIVNPMMANDDTLLWRVDACERNTILFVGRFDLLKGADVALQAFALLVKDNPELKLVFVGPDRGLLGQGAKLIHFDEYRDSLFPSSLRNRVDFRGAMANHDIARLRTQSMVTIICSRWENQAYTLLEAMIQGCPVVSTDAGGCGEILEHGVTGRLAKSGNRHDFADQLSAMLSDPDSAERMGREARRYVLENHSASVVASTTLQLYERIISEHNL